MDIIDECMEEHLVQSILIKEVKEEDLDFSTLSNSIEKRIKRPYRRKKEWINSLRTTIQLEEVKIQSKTKRKRNDNGDENGN
jgi:hypothetical protein